MVVKVPPELLRPYRVDWERDVFSEMRKTLGFIYDDALECVKVKACEAVAPLADTSGDQTVATTQDLVAQAIVGRTEVASDCQAITAEQTIFWPGCTLSSYSQELTEAAFNFLKEHGQASVMSVNCCGHILEFVAPLEERQLYQGSLGNQLQLQGIKRIITACPNCFYSFKRLIDSGVLFGVEILALSEVLDNEGVRFSEQEHPGCGSVCFHDSCPDRQYGLFAETARSVFASVELREMEHSRGSSRCCGLGYLLYLRQPERSAAMAQERVAEFIDSGADCLVTYCANCASALCDPSKSNSVYYYLELLFGIRLNWPLIFQTVAEVHGNLMSEESARSS